MANEIQFSAANGMTAYFLVFSRTGTIWNTSGGTGAFENYATANFGSYSVSAVEQGSASHLYQGTFPAAIPAGTYGINARQQVAGSPAETDPTIAAGNFEWNGSFTAPLSDTATSGQIGLLQPVKLARNYQILSLPIYLKSSADHITPFTSGVVSGQIARDAGAFGPLQSGAFTEKGMGWYSLQSLTSGDLNAGTVALLFTANGISGGQADPLPMAFILQRVSGSV